MRGSEAGTACRRLADGFDDRREGVAKDHGAPGAEAVEVFVAVGVPQVGAEGALDERRIAADRAKRPYRRVHAAGQQCSRPLLQLP